MKVAMVPYEEVLNCWPKVEGYMEQAAKYTYGRYLAQDILDDITDYGYTLWIAYDTGVIKGAVVTKFADYPRKRFLSMVYTGGVDLKEWKDPMLEVLRRWAHDNDCDGIESTGRPGWAKIFSADGHRCVWHTYELPAGEVGLGEQDG